MIWILAIIFLLVLLVRLVKKQLYWKENNVKQGLPIPIFGDLLFTTFRTRTFNDELKKFYNWFPNERYTGIYLMTKPTLLLRDPELIKQITIKDFHYFTDHRRFLSNESDPLWSGNLFFLEGEKWHEMRSTLSPAFTSSKMRLMFSLINECAAQFQDYYLKQDFKVKEIELKDTFTRFANDVIASCAFGLKCDSLTDRDNEFYMKGFESTDFTSFSKVLCILLNLISPRLSKFFGLRLISKPVTEFFKRIITGTIKMREEQNIHRPDMLNLLMEARKGKLKHDEEGEKIEGFASGGGGKSELTDMDITAQAFVFFLAGFETVATSLTFVAYELAVNPEIQEKLREEIDEALVECEGNLTFDVLMKMKYMDMVMSETLRKWPSPLATDRMCVKPYTLQPTQPGESPVNIRVGDIVWMPTFAIHHDPKYYPNPDRFDPERFSDENRHNLTPHTYMPFGSGPRNCIGSRFALMEAKTIIFHILAKFELTVVEKTDIPLKLQKGSFLVKAQNGFWVGLKKRV